LKVPATTSAMANLRIFLRTMSMPRSSEAFTSKTQSRTRPPNNSRAKARTVDVFPVPGGPYNNKWGMLPEATAARRALTTSTLCTMSSNVRGRLAEIEKKKQKKIYGVFFFVVLNKTSKRTYVLFFSPRLRHFFFVQMCSSSLTEIPVHFHGK
jgi:hypothetical protein